MRLKKYKQEVKNYYAGKVEKGRLNLEIFQLEGIRTKEIITRYIPDNSEKNIIDIGGGPGYYSLWLKSKGHNVHLIDLSPENIELAKGNEIESNIKLDSIEAGDATDLPYENDQFDVALLLGPLYHLIERKDRIEALSEAKRVLKPGGILICAVRGIFFASTLARCQYPAAV